MTSYLVKVDHPEDAQAPMRWPWYLLALIVVLVLAWGIYSFSQRAETARLAMAAGQYSRAHDLYLVQADNGDAAAQNALGNLYYLGMGVGINYTEARDWYFKAAKTGFADAQLNLGHLYKQGLGVEHDPVRAFGWYNMAHKYGNPAAEYYLTQVSVEWTLSPLMIDTAQTKWSKLEALVKETL